VCSCADRVADISISHTIILLNREIDAMKRADLPKQPGKPQSEGSSRLLEEVSLHDALKN